jgi:hypothetical protein
MAELEVNLDRRLLEGIRELAIEHYGEDSESSRRHVIETALEMRIIWSHSIERGQQETEEAVSKWEFPESTTKREDSDSIQNWLFRR